MRLLRPAEKSLIFPRKSARIALLHQLIALDEVIRFHAVGVAAGRVVCGVSPGAMDAGEFFQQKLRDCAIGWQALGRYSRAIPDWGAGDSYLPAQEIAIRVDQAVGIVQKDRVKIAEAFAIIQCDEISVGIEDSAKGKAPHRIVGSNPGHEAGDVIGFKPVVVIEEADELGVAQQ